MEMVSYLVMKNNIKRRMAKKSTYLLMLLVPVVLMAVSSMSARIENKEIRVGISGNEEYRETAEKELKRIEGVCFEVADEDSIYTEQVMGTYNYILTGQNDREVLRLIKEAAGKGTDKDASALSAGKRMVCTLFTAYMTIAVLYALGYLKDKRERAVERVVLSGGTNGAYFMGCFLSTMAITGMQMLIVLFGWKILDKNFTFSFLETGFFYLFILLVSNIYSILIIKVSKSEMMAGILGSSGAVLFSLLGGTFLAVDNMPGVLKALSVISPVRWLLEMMS